MKDWIIVIQREDGRLFAAIKQAETREDALAEVQDWCEESRIVAVSKYPAFATFTVLVPVDSVPVVDDRRAWRGGVS